MIRVLIGLSNLSMSQGFKCLLESEKNYEIQVVNNPALLVNALRAIIPHIVMVDFFILNNYLPQLTDDIKVILFDTGCGEENIHYALIAKNVLGVIGTDADESLVKKAIETVVNGSLWIDRKSMTNLLSRLSRLAELWRLSELEMDILHLIGKGMDNVMIADVLGLDENNISVHFENLKKKMKIKDRWDLITMSMQFDKFDVPLD